jgi:hypothetical protein
MRYPTGAGVAVPLDEVEKQLLIDYVKSLQ